MLHKIKTIKIRLYFIFKIIFSLGGTLLPLFKHHLVVYSTEDKVQLLKSYYFLNYSRVTKIDFR